MGSCLSKKSSNVSIPTNKSANVATSTPPPPPPPPDLDQKTTIEIEKEDDNATAKKEIFVIKHRKSHDSNTRPNSSPEPAQICTASPAVNATSAPATTTVRTSSCSREELDAILIQCGRLSRSSSGAQTAAVSGSGKKYSGSKRSYDFDNDSDKKTRPDTANADADDETDEHRTRRRGSPSPHGRRRTPSRERDRDSLQHQQRPGSRERSGVTGGERRVSRSPAKRRSESTGTNNRPGKIVAVPATVSSSSNGEIKRVSVKRNVMSPRSQSPARIGQMNVVEVLDENLQQQHQGSLSRSNSRKGNDNQSPYRRRPLNEISSNVKIVNSIVTQVPMVKPNVEETRTALDKIVVMAHKGMENHQHQNIVKSNVASTESETLNPQTLTRSRSSRLSRDFDLTPEPTATSSYAALLLEDIQNFHQKHNTAASFTLPPCVTKACSILDAVADLNSCTSSSEKFNSPLQQLSSNAPFVESEIGEMGDDLMEPSLHKYVTMRRGTTTTTNIIGDLEEIESLGSNSVMSGGQQMWEPNSVNSKDGSINTRDLLVGEKASVRRLSGKKKTRINERGRVGASSSSSRAAAST